MSSTHQKNWDYMLVTCVVLLTLFGLVMLGSASLNLGKIKFNDNYYYVKHQLLYGIVPGLLLFFITSRLYYGIWEKAALPLFIIALGILLLVFSPIGVISGGANRWLDIAGASLQPGEIVKLATIIYLAAWLTGEKERQHNFIRGFMPFIALLGMLGAILLGQSSTSMFAIIFITACIMYFASGARLSYLAWTLIAGIVAIAIISYFSPYRLARIKTYLNPTANPETSGYHINQALIAIGSGGLTGVGFGQSTTKINYLPEPIGDSIFAVIAEELGFIGAGTVVMLFAILTTRLFLTAQRMQHKFGELLLIGFATMISLQAFINIGAISGLIPLTGMPLPFISYGGTSLAMYLAMMGIAINVSTYAK